MTFSVVDKKTDSILTQQKIRCGPQRKRKRIRRYDAHNGCAVVASHHAMA